MNNWTRSLKQKIYILVKYYIHSKMSGEKVEKKKISPSLIVAVIIIIVLLAALVYYATLPPKVEIVPTTIVQTALKTETLPGTTIVRTEERTIVQTVPVTATPTLTPTERKISILTLAGARTDHVKKMIETEDFKKRFPGVTVEIIAMPYVDMWPKISIASRAGLAPADIIYIDWGWLATLVENGWVEPIMGDDLPPDYKPGIVADWAWDHTTYKGKNYGVILVTNFHVLYYNTKILKEAGITSPPKTWDELTQQCLMIKERGILEYPLTLGMAPTEGLSQVVNVIIKTFGSSTWNEKGYPAFKNERAKEALQMIVDWVQKYKIVDPAVLGITEHDVWKYFTEEKAAFMLNWAMVLPRIKDKSVSKVYDHFGVVEVPASKYAPSSVFGSGMYFGVSSFSKNINLAKDIVKYLGSIESCKELAKLYSLAPAYKSLMNDTDLISLYPEVYQIIPKIYQRLYVHAKTPWYIEASNTWARYIQSTVLGQISIEKMLEDCYNEVLRIIEKY